MAISNGQANADRRGVTKTGLVHRLALAFVALTIISGAVVFAEPAPVDLLMAGVIVLLPLIGLTAYKKSLLLYFNLWLIIAAGGYFASTQGSILPKHMMHTTITLFLSIGMLVIAAFIARNPRRHGLLIMNAQLGAATVAAIVGIIGYFELVPGSHDLFTKFGRATGPFKDPNVFGPFVGFAAIYALHLVLTSSRRWAAALLLMLAFLTLGLLLSFSRGAWISFGVGVLAYGYLNFVTAVSLAERRKLIVVSLIAILAIAFALLAALQSEKISSLLAERASLSQSYDTGTDGRFEGQVKAGRLLLDHPLGLGAAEFQTTYHHEDVHNVYLVMFLNAGWLGGWIYLAAILIPLLLGLRHSFVRNSTQRLFHVVYAAYLGSVVEGIIIDTDHWRHFFLILALVMGIWAGTRRTTITSDPMRERGPFAGHHLVKPQIATQQLIVGRRAKLLRPANIIAGTASTSVPTIQPAQRCLPRRYETFVDTAGPASAAGTTSVWQVGQWQRLPQSF